MVIASSSGCSLSVRGTCPAAQGAAAGVSAAFFNVGIFLGPPIFGAIVDRTGSYTPAWWTMAASGGVALVVLLFVRERHGLA
jgi:predicted MFS family arabinose efflux permease